MEKLEQEKAPGIPVIAEKPFNRRTFFKSAGVAGLGLASTAFVAGKLGIMGKIPGMDPSSVEASGFSDVDILNFALNLEYLEAEFYTMAVYGKTIEQMGIGVNGTGAPGKTMGGAKVNFSNGTTNDGRKIKEETRILWAIAEEVAYDEQQHVLLLRSALGGDAVAKPLIDLNGLGQGFGNFLQFLQLARAFEDTGVSAYGGAIPLISSNAYLAAAVRIGLTEAYHAGNLRLVTSLNRYPTIKLDSQDVQPPPTGKQYFTVDKQGLAIVRTTSEVLAILYGDSTPGASSARFFPNGTNGRINTV